MPKKTFKSKRSRSQSRASVKKPSYRSTIKRSKSQTAFRAKHQPRYNKKYMGSSLGLGETKMIYCRARCSTAFEIGGFYSTGELKFQSFTVGIPWQRPVTTPDQLPTNDIKQLDNGKWTWFVQKSVFDTPRFVKLVQNWKQYAVTGLKIVYIPTSSFPAQTNAGQPHTTAAAYFAGLQNFAEGATQTYLQLMQQNGFKPINSVYRGWSKYISMKALSRSESLVWQDCEGIPDNYDTGLLSEAYSLLRFGLNSETSTLEQQGFIRLQWYVTFRGQNA